MKRWELLLTLAVLLLAWQLLAMALHQQILPSPVQVAGAFVRETERGTLPMHFLASLWRVIASLVISIVLAAPAGLIGSAMASPSTVKE